MRQAIDRHKTAISRPQLSRPLKAAWADGLVSPNTTVLDYGCGRGGDLRRLEKLGFQAKGWDPVHRPGGVLAKSDVVNLGFVVNVIEDFGERARVLADAWSYANGLLIVSARLHHDAAGQSVTREFGDGYITSCGTFQKYYSQSELKDWIDGVLDEVSVPAAPGVFYVFRRASDRIGFLASRYRQRIAGLSFRPTQEALRRHSDLLAPLVSFFEYRGRIPQDFELETASEIRDVFGSLKNAFRVIRRGTNCKHWDEIAEQREVDLTLTLALANFDGRPRFSELPTEIQLDVRKFFTSYKNALSIADDLLFTLGMPGVVDRACRESSVGKRTPSAIYVHESALLSLVPELRATEGCARRFIGRVEGANIIKIHRTEPKVSYLSYPTFDTDPHPVLARSLTVHFQTFEERVLDFTARSNPPVLHRKESFLTVGHPLYKKFARLTRSEERHGLLDEGSEIGTRDGWNRVLEKSGFQLRGHRLVRSLPVFQD